MNTCKHNKLSTNCIKCTENREIKEKKVQTFSNFQQQIYIDMKNLEKLLGSISPKLSLWKETKDKISVLQKRINEAK